MNRIGANRFLLSLAVLVTSVLVAAGCGNAELPSSGEEGRYVDVGNDVIYQVQLTRLLDQNQRPDDNLLEGQPTPSPHQQYMGVFMIIQNDGDKPYTPPRDMTVVDTQGNEYKALDAQQSGFALNFNGPIPPGDEAPPPDSPAASGVDAAAMVLFRISEESATENLPLELEIPVEGKDEPSRIEIDL